VALDSVIKMTSKRLPLGRPLATPFHSRYTGRRRTATSPEVVGAAALAIAVLALLGYMERRRLLRGVAALADAVEEIADVVEDAAEDLATAARRRAEAE
jgi:hypothetical protein